MPDTSDAFFVEMRPLGVMRAYDAGQLVVLEGDPADTLYLICSGAVRVYRNDAQGREITLNTLGAGTCFGEMMLEIATRTASVQTTRASQLCLISRERLEEAIAANPALARHLIGILIARVNHLTQGVSELALQGVEERVVNFLCGQADTSADELSLPAPSLKVIAEAVGASRSMVHKVLTDLTHSGHLRRENEQFRLHPSIRTVIDSGR